MLLKNLSVLDEHFKYKLKCCLKY